MALDGLGPGGLECLQRFERFAGTSDARSNLKRNAVRAFTFVLSSSAAELFFRIASTAVLARLISPEHFGLFMMVTAVTALADQFRDLGLSTATIQRAHITHREVSNLFWINAGAGVAMALVVYAAAPLVAHYFREPRLIGMTMVLATNLSLSGLTVQHEALLARQLKHGQKSLVRLLAFILSSLLAIGLAVAGFGYWALVWRELARSMLIVIGVAWACPWVPGLPDRNTDVRGLVSFGRDLTLTYFLTVVASSVDRFLIGRAFGAGPVALYRQPYQLVVTPMNQLMSPLYQVTLPGLSMLQHEPERYRRFYRHALALVAMVSMPLNVFLAVYSREFTLLVLGPDWEQASIFVRIFALGGILRSVMSTAGFVLVSRGDSKTLLRMGVLNTVVMTILMTVGVTRGAVGVALGEVCSVVLMAAPWLYVAFRGSPVSAGLFLSTLALPAASSVAIGIVLSLFRALLPIEAVPLRVATGAVLATVVMGLTWITIPRGRDEIRGLVSLVRLGQGVV